MSQRRIDFARALTVVALVAAVIGTPAHAVAQEGEDAWDIVAVGVYDLAPGKTPTLVITGTAPSDAPLPLEAALPIPKGASLSWAGEILGGDPAADPTLQVTIDESDSYDLVRFTLEQSRRAQLELTLPEGAVQPTADGTVVELEWTSAGAVRAVVLGMAVDPGFHLEDVEPEAVLEQLPTSVFYSHEFVDVAAGDALSLRGTVVEGPDPELAVETPPQEEATASQQPTNAAAAPVEPEAGGGIDWTIVLIAALSAALAVAVVLLVRQLRRS